MTKRKTLIDNVPDNVTVQVIRRLVKCARCHGLGDREAMIWAPSSLWKKPGDQYHTQCFLRDFGFDAVLKLSPTEAGKFRMCDLSVYQMRKLLRLMKPT